MSDIYDEILSQSDIQIVLEYYGLKVIKNKCICPFHADTRPSMNINKNRGIAKCFACGTGGNSISFIQKYENEINHHFISIKEAMQKAIDIQNLNINIPQNNINLELTEEQKEQLRLNNILKDAMYICENNLNSNSNSNETMKCLNYLKNRNLSTEIMKDFHIGFNYGINSITSQLLKKYKVEDLIKAGITKEYEGKYIDIFSNRIMIPIFDQYGKAVGFGGRIIDNSSKAKYINTMNTELFNKSNLLFNYHKAKSYARNDEIIIVEGYMDVISSKAIGFDNVVGTMGTALTKEHINLLKKLKCEVTLALDNDNAGKDAMTRIIPELLKRKIKVNVLDISRLGNYKDFGDLQEANISKEKIYQTKISAFTFFMQYKYLKDIELTVENVYRIYKKMCNDKVIKDSKDVMEFKEVIMKNTTYTTNEIERIINPKKLEDMNRIDKYKNVFFYNNIKNIINQYAIKHQDIALSKFIQSKKLDIDILTKTLDNDKYLSDKGLNIRIGDYIREVIYNLEEYKQFNDNKMNILDKLLNNVKSFDFNGNIVNIELTLEQKEMVIKQYNESFDEAIKQQIEQNPDEFEELFIANNYKQFENLFPKTYLEQMKEQTINHFKNEQVMEAVHYALAYTEDMKSKVSEKYITNGKYKTLLVFNNNKNILSLSTDNIKLPQKEEIKEKENLKKQCDARIETRQDEKYKSNPMSVLIKLSGNERETMRGLYLPMSKEIQIYIPRELYNKKDDKLEIVNNNSNNVMMSEYKIDTEKKTKLQWFSRLSLEQFYHKYYDKYEIQLDKEVMA
ncbi:MAG: DNA primase [Bacilli bacterium]|nr:DNA primase [Bacilli bacterium]